VVGGCVGAGVGGIVGANVGGGVVTGVVGMIGAMVGSESGSDDGVAFGTSVSFVDGVVGDDSDSDGVVVSIAATVDVAMSVGVVVIADSSDRSADPPEPHAMSDASEVMTTSRPCREVMRLMRTG